MTKTGDYIIQYYSDIGSKIKNLTETSDSLTDSINMAEETIIVEEAIGKEVIPKSFTVDRRVFNSLDARYKCK